MAVTSDETPDTELTHRRAVCLEITLPDQATYTVSLGGENEVTLGRSRRVGVYVEHRSVSREHARLSRVGAAIDIEDLGSRNGTRVRGRNVAANQPTRVGLGEVFEIGSVALRVVPERRFDPARRSIERRQSSSARREIEIVGAPRAPSSTEMQWVLSAIDQIATSDMNILLLGETGVGKDTCAEMIHRRSLRSLRAFVRVDCSTLRATLYETDLFANELGLPGLLESGIVGTVFLDKVAELPWTVQGKLLRVLDRQETLRSRARDAMLSDARFVAATTTSLERALGAGRFRADLYYRLAGMTIQIPALRERRDEVATLAELFIESAARRRNKNRVAVTAEALAALEDHSWPDNVRELRDVIERAFVMCDGESIGVEHLSLHAAATLDTVASGSRLCAGSSKHELEDLDRRWIDTALVAAHGDVYEAARRLGVSYGALRRRLQVPRRRCRAKLR